MTTLLVVGPGVLTADRIKLRRERNADLVVTVGQDVMGTFDTIIFQDFSVTEVESHLGFYAACLRKSLEDGGVIEWHTGGQRVQLTESGTWVP